MRVIVVGLGIQGHKRRRLAGADIVCTVDVRNPDADFRHVREVPLASYDAALLCVPDSAKLELLGYLIEHRKHVLIEKPLVAEDEAKLEELAERARRGGIVLYVAYNHRFEPHFARMRDLIASGALGKIYRCRMFYGNGTARLVRNSDWRDQGTGVLDDLGSHMLDTARFWFGDIGDDFSIVSADCFENRSLDHVVIAAPRVRPQLEFEMTLLSWRNHFTCDLFAEKGSAHISSLCKWGPSEFTYRERIMPSGRPPEQAITLVQDDPTWALEYEHFKTLCQKSRPTDLSNDIWLNRVLRKLGGQATERGRP
jgi:scyllo-inositol 2-dehydrogenase (NADP+)